MTKMLMDVSRNGGEIVFRTHFSDEYDLVQVLCGLSSTSDKNCPVDFRLAALQHKSCRDIWHMDQVLAFSTDECSPMVLNGEDIGGNHGHPCAIRVHAPGHGLDLQDVGSLWQDEAGVTFTLLRVISAQTLLFLSENIGPSLTRYEFANTITGALTYVENGLHTAPILPQGQQGQVQLTPAIRHTRREAVCLQNGQWIEATYNEGCERAEIREEYEIINPATVARAIREGRPEGGYQTAPSLAVGEAMFLHRMTYRIEPDGTILCDFDHACLQDVPMPCYLGIMHQLKCDVYGGGVWRYIPKVRPFTAKGKAVDFTRPFLTTQDTLPDNIPLTPDLWTDLTSPPDRQIDFLRRADGTLAVGFASGFLPVGDGEPARRAASITDAATIVSSCKTYPTFAGGLINMRKEHRSFPRLKGVAYKKYFLPCAQEASLYTIPYGRDTYVYMDAFSDAHQTLTYPAAAPAALLEATLTWQQTASDITAQGSSGYAVFRLTKD